MIRMATSSSITFFTFLIFLFHFQHSLSFSLSVEKPEQDTIVSPNATFTAGFYPIGENAYSFAIWFTQKHKHLFNNATIVWMANRDQPVNGKRSRLSLLKTGNLVLTDAGQSNIWSTNTNSSKPLEVFLYDTGNLVLREHNNTNLIMWQSFDFPTDTLLPGQSFTRHMNLVSSKSSQNYSSGFYKFFFDNDNLLHLLYDDPRVSSVYWPDPWLISWQAGRSTYNSSRVAILNSLGNFSSSDDFFLTTSDYGMVLQRRLTLDYDGNIRVYSRKHGQEEEKWFVSGQFRQHPCKLHGICGPNSICSNNRSGRKCSCLPGYNKINNQDWSQGCKPNFQLSCDNRTNSKIQFQQLQHIEFFGYDYGYFENYTYNQCKNLCLRLCECIGFQYRFMEGSGTYSCYPKTQFLNGYHSPSFPGSMFLLLLENNINFSHENIVKDDSLVCLQKAPQNIGRLYFKDKENRLVKFMLWFASSLGGIEILCFSMVACFLFKNRKHSSVGNEGYILAAAAAVGFSKFTYSELKRATKGFSQEIGRGTGGTVYKGVLSDNRIAAVKRLNEANQGESEFLAEVSIVGRLNHMNLIGMWGYCAEGKHRLLVFEYMEKGSLDENLSANALDWDKRYNIALGTAQGLHYLHEECLEWVLHCDIKPQNILIDSNYQPKVADFGLSKLLNRNKHDDLGLSRMRGTRGYMAPEWVFNLPITSKVDVYSYGVVMLEMITGKSAITGIQITGGDESQSERLITWVRDKRNSPEVGLWLEQIVDPTLESNYDIIQLETLATVALDCVIEDKDMRPSMSQIVERLQSF